jgi:hypothetical protein
LRGLEKAVSRAKMRCELLHFGKTQCKNAASKKGSRIFLQQEHTNFTRRIEDENVDLVTHVYMRVLPGLYLRCSVVSVEDASISTPATNQFFHNNQTK